jgi:hypothetical protein
MAEKRVTYLIGAGASANALPVVNGMNERLWVFYYYTFQRNVQVRNFGPEFDKNINIENLLINIEQHYSIDTYAKKLIIRENKNEYLFLKNFLTSYFLFEQTNKNKTKLNESIDKYIHEHKRKIESKIYRTGKTMKSYAERLFDKMNIRIDYRYDSFFATLLQKEDDILKLPNNINIISWNYDIQFELAYQNFINKIETDNVKRNLNIKLNYYDGANKIDKSIASIYKINGEASYTNKELIFNSDFNTLIDKIKSEFENNDSNKTNLHYSWENKDFYPNNLSFNLGTIMSQSEIIVIIGYSFPTFNREIDRKLFYEFNKVCAKKSSGKVEAIFKKIYIQDTPENAPKIKERLKAIGNNLYDVAEIYPEVVQFLIPYEL